MQSSTQVFKQLLQATISSLTIVFVFIATPLQAKSQEPDVGKPATSSSEFPSSVSLLPQTTEGFIQFSDLPELAQQWEKTSLSGLRHDPAMQPFIESQQDTIERKLADLGMKIGLTLDDLCSAVSGEVVLAWLRFEAPKRPFAVTLMADTRGRDDARKSMLEKVDKELRKRGAQVTSTSVQGESVTVYTMPRQKGQLYVVRFATVTVDSRVIISDRPETLGGLVSAAKNGQPQSLVSQADYIELFEKVKESHVNSDPIDPKAPKFRWFARPLPMGKIVRELAEIDRGNKIDILKLLSNQGFDAIKVAGGDVYLATESYDILHQGYVLAPPTAPEPNRYRLAAAAMQFPNKSFGDLPSWVVPSAATLFRGNWRLENAFWAMETLIDEAFTQEDFFRDMLKGFRNDPAEGIEIDLENDIVANLGEDFLILTENEILAEADNQPAKDQQPAENQPANQALPKQTETREQVILAIKITGVDVISRVLNDEISKDKDIFAVPFDKHPIWEVRPSEYYDPDELEDDEFGFGFTDEDVLQAEREEDDADEDSQPLLDAWAFTVFDGYLMISSHSDFLIKVIEYSKAQKPTFATVPQFQQVQKVIAKEAGEKPWSMERTVITERAWKVKYHLIRQGKFLESDSLLATIVRRIKTKAEKAAGKDDAEKTKIDFSKLPEFEAISKYLKPGGGFVQTTEDGWSITQFLMK